MTKKIVLTLILVVVLVGALAGIKGLQLSLIHI